MSSMFAMHSKAACSAACCYGKSTCSFFTAVSKVSFDAVTSMPSASAIEITNHKHCQQHQKLQKQHNTRNSRNNTTPMTSGTGRVFNILWPTSVKVSSATLWQASSLRPSLPWLHALLLPWPFPWLLPWVCSLPLALQAWNFD